MQVIFLFYEGMTALDAVGPHEILCRLPGISVKRVAKKSGNINTDSGLILSADYNLSEVLEGDVLLFLGQGMPQHCDSMPRYLLGSA